MNTRSLTGNRDRDKGWTQDEAGNWTPSLFDRRRVGVAHLGLVAEANGLPGLPMPAAVGILVNFHAKDDEEDAKALLENFGAWMNKVS